MVNQCKSRYDANWFQNSEWCKIRMSADCTCSAARCAARKRRAVSLCPARYVFLPQPRHGGCGSSFIFMVSPLELKLIHQISNGRLEVQNDNSLHDISIAMLSLIIPQHSHVQNSKHIQLQLGESTKPLTLQGAKRPARNQKQGSYRLLTLCLYPCFHFTVDFWGPLPSAAFHAIGRSFAHKTGGANPVHQSIAPMQSSLRIKSWPCKSTTSGASSPSKARSSVERPNFSSTSSRSLLHRFWSFGASVLQISRRERAQLPKKFSLVKSSPNKSDGAWLSWVKNVRRSSAKSSSVGLNQENTWTGEGPPPRK